ncbi:MAG TPA: response regulator [Polyangiaceae bacterium]|nr:response regulator [Polyangiaceae bacterium]
MNEPPRVLCVDDEPNVLEGLERVLSESFDVTTEVKSLAAVDLLSTGLHDFDVIISDMRMPLLNGAKFLAQAATLAPEAARILLTGFAELQPAIDAVNTGASSASCASPALLTSSWRPSRPASNSAGCATWSAS